MVKCVDEIDEGVVDVVAEEGADVVDVGVDVDVGPLPDVLDGAIRFPTVFWMVDDETVVDVLVGVETLPPQATYETAATPTEATKSLREFEGSRVFMGVPSQEAKRLTILRSAPVGCKRRA